MFNVTVYPNLEVVGDLKAVAWALLKVADKEFIPPLSSREGPKDVDLAHTVADKAGEPKSYFEAISAQPVIFVQVGQELAGFLSYKTDYRVPETGVTVDAYISTIIVSPDWRGKGLARLMYQSLIDMYEKTEKPYTLATRTWHTNNAHIELIKTLGFELVCQKKDGRGRGIDTVIYARQYKLG